MNPTFFWIAILMNTVYSKPYNSGGDGRSPNEVNFRWCFSAKKFVRTKAKK